MVQKWVCPIKNGVNEIDTEIAPDEYGNEPGPSAAESKAELIKRMEEYYPTTDKSDDPHYRSLGSSTIATSLQKPIKFKDVLKWKNDKLEYNFRAGVKQVTILEK